MELILASCLSLELLHPDLYRGTTENLANMSRLATQKHSIICYNNTDISLFYDSLANQGNIILSHEFANIYLG